MTRNRRVRADDPIRHWPRFAAIVRKRLQKGAQEYGDTSLAKSPERLLVEVQEELCDVCGWSLILWVKLESLRLKIRKAEEQAQADCHG